MCVFQCIYATTWPAWMLKDKLTNCCEQDRLGDFFDPYAPPEKKAKGKFKQCNKTKKDSRLPLEGDFRVNPLCCPSSSFFPITGHQKILTLSALGRENQHKIRDFF